MRGRHALIAQASHDDHALLAACRDGDTDAARQLVQRHQRDLLRLAYLLAGDTERSIELASRTLVELLRDPPEQLDQPNQRLALDLAASYLRNPSRSSWLAPDDDDRNYNVDDERSKTKEALDRLEPGARAVLALEHFTGTPEPETRRALDLDDKRDKRAETLEQARGRIALAAGRDPGAPIQDLLNRVAIDAPAIDLWSEVSGSIERAWSSRRRRERLLTAAAVAAVLVVLGGSVIWLSGFRPGGDDGSGSNVTDARPAWPNWPPSAEEIPTPTVALASFAGARSTVLPEPVGVQIIDTQFLRMIEQAGDGRSALEIYDPETNSSTAFLPAGGSVMISPDGTWMTAERSLRETPGHSLLTAGRLDGSASWELEIATSRAMAVGDDDIYVLNLSGPDTLQIQTIDLATGKLAESWPVEGIEYTPSAMRAARLQRSTNSDRLFLLAEWKLPDPDSWPRTIISYDLATGEQTLVASETADAPVEGIPPEFSVASARPVPGEDTVYSAVQDRRSAQVSLKFLDLNTGEMPGLLLRIPARVIPLAGQRGENEVHLVPSNTGEMLYVIQTRQRQVAIVDLSAQRLIGVIPLTPRPGEESLFERNLNHVSYLEALLSPDGTRLYLAVNREKNQAINSYPAQSPVWVINTTTWQVEDRWMVAGLPRRMTMDGDGKHIYIRSARADGTVRLTTFSTGVDRAVNVWDEVPSPEWADIQRIGSAAQIYHELYGIRPRTSPLAPLDNSVLAVLPGVSVEAEDAVAGAETIVTARIVHPITGAPASTDRTLRFDPDATVAVELTNGEAHAILVPSSVETGVYMGRVRMNGPGIWDARVTIINEDGTTWTVMQNAAIEVSEGVVTQTGGAYRFVIRPGNPVNRRTITVRVWMVGSDEREWLPEEIEFLDLISEDVQIVLTHPSGERIVEDLSRIDHDSFLGWVRFGSAGEWTAQIVLGMGTGERLTVNAGTLQIKDLTEPYQRSTGADAASTDGGTRMANPSGR